MSEKFDSREIYLEIGKKKVFAVSAHWPGWARSGKDEVSAVQALISSAEKYAAAVKESGLVFNAPLLPFDYAIKARLPGNITTDFGAPDAFFPDDWGMLSLDEVERYHVILSSCWNAFDRAVKAASGRELSYGPRGGGRDLGRMIRHVIEAEESYLRTLGVNLRIEKNISEQQEIARLREEAHKGLELSAAGQIEKVGPRGGKRWPARFFVRRVAWHALDHAWELEARLRF
jgi:hypothetical protein